MTVKQLKNQLKDLPDEAAVVMYNGYAEEDCFCTKVYQTTKSEYDEYCKGDSFTDYVPSDVPIVVLQGEGYTNYKYTD